MNATDSPAAAGGRSGAWRWGSLAVLAAVMFVYVVVVTRPRPAMQGKQDPSVGHKLHYLQLEPLTGDAEAVSLDDLRGRVALVNYWGTWCGPCVAEFPHLVELAAQFADQEDFRFLPVSCGGQGNDAELDGLRAETEAFLRSRNVKLATYADQNAASRRALAIGLGLEQFAYPTTLVLDRGGTIRGFWVGYNPVGVEQMTTLVAELLHKPESRPSAKP